MRSSVPLPGNPWPHDMVITVEDDLQTLEELLWIREAWELDCWSLELPPPLTDSPAPVVGADRSEVAAWQRAWPEVWTACVTFAGQIRDPELMDKLHGTGLDADERAHLLEQLVGPSWRERFGDSALTGAYVEWSSALRVQEVRSATVPRAEDHERMSLTALIPAWRAGLTKIVTIPSRGSFTLRLGAASLLVTAETRDDPERYSEALRSFGATLG